MHVNLYLLRVVIRERIFLGLWNAVDKAMSFKKAYIPKRRSSRNGGGTRSYILLHLVYTYSFVIRRNKKNTINNTKKYSY